MMVRLENVNKYYNKGKKNEIHVINDTSLDMEDKGLITVLGPSGCGKTTLLNAIGGLDKVKSGNIYVNGELITGKRAGTVDRIRDLNVGYIFQDYNLVDTMTVFDNVAIALKMIGVKDEEEIREKVNYVLEKVGMYRYRNRYADMLSGGERQRVGIARAIVKDPAVIIADEPTGNLDSKNTLEVMNMIKAISREKLVILVTHEEELARFYASRIIRLVDGKVVSDEINQNDDGLDYRTDNKIYLKDIKDHKRLKADKFNIDFYNDGGSDLALDIVIKNGNIYIQAKNERDKVKVVEKDSGTELVDDHYTRISREETDSYSFDLEKLRPKTTPKCKTILSIPAMLKRGFRSIADYSLLRKVLLVGFLISAVFITYSVSNIFGVMNITDDEFVTKDKSYLTLVSKKTSVDTYEKYENDDDYLYIMPGNSLIELTMHLNDYFQTEEAEAVLSGSLSDAGKLKDSDMVYGDLPEKENEIAVDKMIIDSIIEDQNSKMAGYGDVDSFLKGEVNVSNMGDLTIVGITDKQSPCIYAARDQFINLLANAQTSDTDTGTDPGFGSAPERAVRSSGSGDGDYNEIVDYKLKESDVKIVKGDWPENDYEVAVNEKNKDDMAIGKKISTKVNDTKLKVVGYYSDKYDSDYMLVNNDTVKYDLITGSTNVTLCPADKAAALKQLKADGLNVKDTYEQSRTQYISKMWSSMLSTIIMAAVIMIISLIEIYLMIRASFLSRVKEVGVYRAIGVKKGDIYKMFTGEIFAITTVASMPGFILTAYVLYRLAQMSYFSGMFMVTVPILILCVIVIYVLNIIFGLLPVFRTIRKSPAEILSRNDVE